MINTSLKGVLPLCLSLSISIFLLGFVGLQSQTILPNLGTAAPFGAFSGSGAIENTGLTVVNGDVGTNAGSFTGFPPGVYTGAKHVSDAVTLTAKNDLVLAYNSMNDATHAVMYDTAIGATMGNGQVLTPRTYGRGDVTTVSGNLSFDALGDPNACFIVKIRAALNVSKNTNILLLNGARASNIFWAVDGAVSILDNSSFKGTITANGAIHLYGGTSLEGRALAVVGAVTLASNSVTVPGTVQPPDKSIVVISPSPGDTLQAGNSNYSIVWGGNNIAPQKTFEYSLDNGTTWSVIGETTTNDYGYNWNVPDLASSSAMVRITDANNTVGVSGVFVIQKNQTEGTIDAIVFSGLNNNNIANNSELGISWTFTEPIGNAFDVEYSLDNETTWNSIATVAATESASTSWITTSSGTYNAVYIRVTSSNGATKTSSPFSISTATSASDNVDVRSYLLSNNPNPAENQTTIRFTLPVSSNVTLSIVDSFGRTASSVINGQYDMGTHTVFVDTATLSSGQYSCYLQAGPVLVCSRIVLMK